MGADLLAGAQWVCGSTAPGAVEHPGALATAELDWIPATVPGTAAGALRAAGRWQWGVPDEDALDGSDWWFRCSFAAPEGAGPHDLALDGLATLADVWLNGSHVLASTTMFASHRVPVESLAAENELVIRCAALGPVLARRHPRPRWKSRLVRSQSQRWYRTSLLGRMPGWAAWGAPVGPWRPVTLRARDRTGALTAVELHATPDAADGGLLTINAVLSDAASAPAAAFLHAAGERGELALRASGTETVITGTLALNEVERWWPHTHGPQPLYAVELEVDGDRIPLRHVGFRAIEADRDHDGFRIRVNGVPIFCRGAIWGPPDCVSLAAAAGEVRQSIELARDAGMNMLRVAGYIAYEDATFWDACDELGVMVWQDCMFASVDPPEDPEFAATIEAEMRQVFGALTGRPSLTVACGSSESFQQASMYGLEPGSWHSPVLEQTIPGVLDEVVPGLPYVPSSPSGGDRPFSPDAGVAHYFGVGGYLRPAEDARLAGVRFASECLSFGTPPDRETVDEVFGSALAAGHSPRWKLTVARDAGTSWDFEDIRDHYVRELFAVDPMRLRYSDPERALDLGRAAVAEMMAVVVSDWRRERSICGGALVLTWQDLWPGAGWGVIDSFGRPKAPYYAMRRVCAPLAVLINDDGLSGLRLAILNDAPAAFTGTLALTVFNDAGAVVETGERPVEVSGHSSAEIRADLLLGGFRDLNFAYRFTPLAYDVVAAEIRDADGVVRAAACHAVGGPARPRLPETGLTARAEQRSDGSWSLAVTSRLFAQYVAVDVPGFRPSDSWFHVLPGGTVTLDLHGTDPERRPAGSVRALNATATARLEVIEP